MVMVHPSVEPKACWEFEGDILILHHPTTISVKYQAMGNFTVLVALTFVLHDSSLAAVFQVVENVSGGYSIHFYPLQPNIGFSL